MAVVAMEHVETFKHYSEVVGCVYCDECGSFKIERRFTKINPLWILVAAIIPFLIWYDSSKDARALLGSFVCFGFILIVLIPILRPEPSYRCQKCGNEHITGHNALGYTEYDTTVLDVPYNATEKYHLLS